MELRQIRYFVAVAEERSFVRGAKRMGISQPPLSRQIANLEMEIGALLLNRTKQGVSLTEGGRVFYDAACELLANVGAAVKLVRQIALRESRSVAIGFGGAAAYSFLPSLVRCFRANFPDIELTLKNMPMDRQFDALMQKSIDVGFLPMPVRSTALDALPILRTRLVVAMPTGHKLSKVKDLKLSSLADCGFVISTQGSNLGFNKKVSELCAHAGFVPKISNETATLESVINLVSVGAGIAIVPSMRRPQSDDVVYKAIRDRYAVIDFAMTWHKGRISKEVDSFVSFARDWVKKT